MSLRDKPIRGSKTIQISNYIQHPPPPHYFPVATEGLQDYCPSFFGAHFFGMFCCMMIIVEEDDCYHIKFH